MDRSVRIKDCPQPIRRIAIHYLGHDKPTLLLNNQQDASASALIGRYARRLLNKYTVADAVDLLDMDALSSARPLHIDLDAHLTLMASVLYRRLANRLGERFHSTDPASLFHKLVQAHATLAIKVERIELTLGRRAYSPHLLAANYGDSLSAISWPHNRALKIKVA